MFCLHGFSLNWINSYILVPTIYRESERCSKSSRLVCMIYTTKTLIHIFLLFFSSGNDLCAKKSLFLNSDVSSKKRKIKILPYVSMFFVNIKPTSYVTKIVIDLIYKMTINQYKNHLYTIHCCRGCLKVSYRCC